MSGTDRSSVPRRPPRWAVPLLVALAVLTGTAVLVAALSRGDADGDGGGNGAGPATVRIEITGVTEVPGPPGARRLRIAGVLAGSAASAPDTYVFVTARPADGQPIGGGVADPGGGAPARRMAHVSAGTVQQGDGPWTAEVDVAAVDDRPLALVALAGLLCPGSVAAPCQVDPRQVVHALATGTDDRTWLARSPGVEHRPA